MLELCDNLDKSIIVIKINRDNNKFPNTIVYYTKHTNTLVHSDFGITKIQTNYMHNTLS